MIKLNDIIDEVFSNEYDVVFLHAHPDDESFLSAGIINQLILIGRRVTIAYTAADIVQNQTIVRQKEAIEANNILGVNKILFLEFCEPKYSKERVSLLIKQKIERVSENIFTTFHKNDVNPPFILISYDRNGGYGNKDHKIVYTIGRNLQKKYRSLIPFLFEITINRDKVLKWLDDAKNRLTPQSMPKLSYWFSEFGLPFGEITHYYQLTENQLRLKRRALTIHKSQITPNEFPLSLLSDDFRELFGCEFLRIY